MKKRKWRKRFLILLVLTVIGELVARFGLGLGQMPVFIEHSDYEYIYAPNQDVSRFGNRIQTNSLSMRSKPLSKKDKVRILKIGDSIVNGGAHVDQDSLASTRLENALSTSPDDSVRVLNISAGSWGPDNAAAYLNKHGHFDATMMVLVFSSHDLHDNMHHRKVVGVHPSWPDRGPALALTDGFGRYVWPKVQGWFSDDFNEYEYLVGFDDTKVNEGWAQLFDYAEAHQLELLVYLHPEQPELKQGAFNSYGQEIVTMLEARQIEWRSGLEAGISLADYRDEIHLNMQGHRKLANYLLPDLEEHVQSQSQ